MHFARRILIYPSLSRYILIYKNNWKEENLTSLILLRHFLREAIQKIVELCRRKGRASRSWMTDVQIRNLLIYNVRRLTSGTGETNVKRTVKIRLHGQVWLTELNIRSDEAYVRRWMIIQENVVRLQVGIHQRRQCRVFRGQERW